MPNFAAYLPDRVKLPSAGLFRVELLAGLVELPCTIAFFVPADGAETPRSDGPLRLTADRNALPGLAEEIRAERDRVAGFVSEPFRCRFRASLIDRFETVGKELERRREDRAAQRQKFDLALKGNRISARPSAFPTRAPAATTVAPFSTTSTRSVASRPPPSAVSRRAMSPTCWSTSSCPTPAT